MSGGWGLLVRPRTATFLHRLLTTPSRWANWTASCYSIVLPGWVPPFCRWRYLMYSGTRATSRKGLPSHTGRTSISQQVVFLPSDNAHVLTLDAKLLANQTYDEVTMMGVGREFNIERTSLLCSPGTTRGSREVASQCHKHRQQCQLPSDHPQSEQRQELDWSAGPHG